MEVVRVSEPREYRERVFDYLVAREAEHNLLFGILSNLVAGMGGHYRSVPLLTSVEKDGRVLMAALMTPPYNLVLSIPEDPAAVSVLADKLAGTVSLPGVTGPKDEAAEFAGQWSTLTEKAHRLTRQLRIYRLEKVIPPREAKGTLRRAGPGDRETIIEWILAFNDETATHPRPTRADLERLADQEGERRVYLWDDDGPVSLAGVGGPTPNGIRIGPVYTPPALRGRGYASACVAEISSQSLASGKKFCFLFTDLANPTSNHIYQDIGYDPVSDVDMYSFG